MTPFKFFKTYVSPKIDWDILGETRALTAEFKRFEILTQFENWSDVKNVLDLYSGYSAYVTIVYLKFGGDTWVQDNPRFITAQKFEVLIALYL